MRQARVTPAGGLRPWFAWDPRLQVAAAVVFMAAVSAIAWFSGDIVAAAHSLNSWTVVEAARAVWRVAEPVVAGGSVYVVVMGVVVACVAAALGQVALEGTSKS